MADGHVCGVDDGSGHKMC